MIAVLAGGTGGAKLARGMLDVAGAENLVVIANTADDVDIYGVHVSPDPDLITYWLADLIDARGYGIGGDTWEVMGALEAAGQPTWFRLGDRDLAMCLIRTELLRRGVRMTDAHAAVVKAAGAAPARVLPMCDEQVRTEVRAGGQWQPFQEFMIVNRAASPIEGVELRGIEAVRASAEVTEAIADADAIVIGPSNPVISIGPILRVPGVSEAIRSSRAPVVAVSPFVGGRVLKGPTEPFMAFAGLDVGARGVLAAYDGLLDGLLCDEPLDGAPMPIRVEDTLMDSAEARRRVAEATLGFASDLAARGRV